MKKENNKNGFLITWVSCIVFLLMLCFLGVNGTIRGTYSATTYTCDSGYTLVGSKYCCPSTRTYVSGRCVNPTEASKGYCTKTVTASSANDSACGSGWTATSATSLPGGNFTVNCKSNSLSVCGSAPKNATASSTTTYGCYKTSAGHVWVSTESAVANANPKVSASSKSACEALNNPSSSSSKPSSSSSVSYGCYLSGGLYHWVSTSSTIGQTGNKVSASSKSACEALNNSSGNNSCPYTSEGHCKSVTGRSCVYGTDGCWRAASASGTVPSRSCTEEFGSVANGYWAGMCETVPKTDGTYDFVCQKGNNCQLACVSGYTLENGSCVKCEDCEPCENPACYYNSSKDAYSWGTYDGVSGWTKTDLSQDKCVNNPPSSNPPSSKPASSNPTSSKPASSNPASSKPASSNPTYSKPASSSNNVTENPATGQIAMFIIWIVGLATVVYSVWYFRNTKKEN